MASTGLDAFDSTVQKTNVWLTELQEKLALENRKSAYAALRAVLHTLRDRLPVEEAVQLGAQLPMLVRGLYYEGWTPAGKPEKTDREEFLRKVADQVVMSGPVDPERLTRGVFELLAEKVSEGEIEDVASSLPKSIRQMWP
ncbi:MAG: DUF2267 domain-containing protein [Thermoleophilia bacterium]